MFTSSDLIVIASALAIGLTITIVYLVCQAHEIDLGQLIQSTFTGRNS